MKTHFILYVHDQELSKEFYAKVLGMEPILHVPGMTEFSLSETCILGIMPESGIVKLLGDKLPALSSGRTAIRAEIYIHVDDVEYFHKRALASGAHELSTPSLRNWGDFAAYSLDPDGHVLAFARRA